MKRGRTTNVISLSLFGTSAVLIGSSTSSSCCHAFVVMPPAAVTTTTRRPRPATTTHHQRANRRFVARVPDSVMEQFSTEILLDRILDESLRFSARRPIIMEFDPAARSMWRRWRGTVLAETWVSAVKHVVWAVFVYLLLRKYSCLAQFVDGFDALWMQMISIATFTLSFFVNQAYTLWRTCLTISRTLQGRVSDIMMTLSTHATRMDDSVSGCSTYTPGARKFLSIMARYVRLFHILCYGSFTRSHRPLLTPRGMRRLVERGVMTREERRVLVEAASKVSATQRFNVVLMWIGRGIIEGRKAGLLDGGSGFEQAIISKLQDARGQANSIESQLRGRMPFAYAHVVQVLVDAVLWMYPIAAFTSGFSMHLGAFGTGVLTICYQGLFDLSKRFLDPYHNENFWSGDDALLVDTLLAEVNAGTVRWQSGLDMMPIQSRAFGRADRLDKFTLPDEGFTSEQAAVIAEQERVEADRVAFQGKLTLMEVQAKVEQVLEREEEEYEETKRILNAPPGSDFVPGLDDEGESLKYFTPLSDERDEFDDQEEIIEQESDSSERFERFLNATTSERMSQ